MPQCKAVAAYKDELDVLESIDGAGEEAPEMVLSDFNRQVPSHMDSRTFATAMGCTMVKDGSEGRLHKDWLLCTGDTLHAAHAWYEDGVADHPVVC